MLRVDEAASELRRVGKNVGEDAKHIGVLNGLTQGYTTEWRMLK